MGLGAGWSSPVARQAHNLKVTGSNPVPASRTSHTSRHLRTIIEAMAPEWGRVEIVLRLDPFPSSGIVLQRLQADTIETGPGLVSTGT